MFSLVYRSVASPSFQQDQIQDMLKKTLEYVLRQSDRIHHRSLAFHTKIFKAIQKGQPELAGKHMFDHIEDIESEMYSILKQANGDESTAK